MPHPIEEYAEELLTMKNIPQIDMSKLSWSCCIRHKVYVQPKQKDSNGMTFNSVYAQYVVGTLLTNDDLTEDQIVALINKWPSADYTKCIMNLVNLLITHPNVKDYTKFKPVFYNLMDRYVTIIKLVHIIQAEKLEFDVDFIMTICKHILNLEPIHVYDSLIYGMVEYGFTWKHIDIPEDAYITNDTFSYLLTHVSIDRIKEHYLGLIARKRIYMYAFIKLSHEVPPEFEGKIDTIIKGILIHNEDEITPDAFDQCEDKFNAIVAYIDEYHKAPPEWMIMKEYREFIIYSLSKIENYVIPDYVYNYKTLACEHYDKESYYINTETDEIKCEECWSSYEHKDKLNHIYNIKCLICFDEHPDKMHVFKCGHTVCLDCHKRMTECPLCNRNDTDSDDSDDSETDFVIAVEH